MASEEAFNCLIVVPTAALTTNNPARHAPAARGDPSEMSDTDARPAPGPRYFLRPEDVAPYSPANHVGTSNRRVIAPETVGATQMEVLIGTIERGGAALPHAHPTIEQCCYMLAGRARVEIAGQTREIGAGEFCFFPIGAEHTFTVISEEPVRVMVIYAPPYGEDPNKVVRGAGAGGHN